MPSMFQCDAETNTIEYISHQPEDTIVVHNNVSTDEDEDNVLDNVVSKRLVVYALICVIYDSLINIYVVALKQKALTL